MLKYPINVTIDTNTFYAAKYDLSEKSTLQLLVNHVKNGKVKVVLSNIVIRESKKHLTEQVNNLCSITRRLRKEVLDVSTTHLISNIGLNRLLDLVKDKKTLVDKSAELFEQYLKDINVEILTTDLINLDKIIDDYFEIKPPFEQGEKKRKEFPDAFIANQIRERFGENETVTIISQDKGVKEACQSTPNHIFLDSLGELYNMINKEEGAYNETISMIEALQYQSILQLLLQCK